MALPYHKMAVAATAKLLVSASRVRITGWSVINNAATMQTLKFYNANATADVTMASTVPDYCLSIPANATAALGAGNNRDLSEPLEFHKGLVIAMCNGFTDANVTPSADDSMSVNLELGN